MRMNNRYMRQRGLTLVELLIGLSVGVIVLGGAITVYASSVQSSTKASACAATYWSIFVKKTSSGMRG